MLLLVCRRSKEKEAPLMNKKVIRKVNYKLIRGGAVNLNNKINNIETIGKTNRNISLSL